MNSSTYKPERIGDYIKAALEALFENNNELTPGKLWTIIPKKVQLSEYEIEKTETGKIRWIVALSAGTIGLTKAGYLQKEKKKWFLTQKGKNLLSKDSNELYELVKKLKNFYRKGNKEIPKDILVNELKSEENLILNFNNDYKNLKVTPESISFSNLLNNVEEGIIKLPAFQRDFVWDPKDIEELLNSILRGYPIGSFIFWRTTKPLEYQKEIAGRKINEIRKGKQITYVIDGQQRITSLFAAIRGEQIRGERYSFYFDLSTLKFKSERKKQNEFNESGANKAVLEKLFSNSGTDFLLYLNGYSENEKKVLAKLRDKFNDYSFASIAIEDLDEYLNIEDETIIKTITEIFTSINSTGSKLSQVSIIVAKCWGGGFDIRKKINEVLLKIPDIKEETIVQVAGAISNEKRISYASIIGEMDQFIEDWQENWELIREAIFKAADFVRNDLKIKNLKLLPFDSILIPISYFYYIEPNPTLYQKNILKKWFWRVGLSGAYSNNPYFRVQIDCNRMDDLKVGKDIHFDYEIDWDNLTSNLIKQQNLKNSLSKTVLCLYASLNPTDFKDNSVIDIERTYSEFNKSNLHHFFPKNYLNKSNNSLKENQDSVVNIALITASLNNEISNLAPSIYIQKMLKVNPNLIESLKTHLIFDTESFGILRDDFETFLNKRAEAIDNEFRKLLEMPLKTKFVKEQEFEGPLDILEVKIRELISQVLENNYGLNYWEETIPLDVQGTVNKKIESKIRISPFKEKKLEEPRSKIDMLDMGDYFKIIESNWTIFSEIFKSKDNLKRYFQDLRNYRNHLKHNYELDEISRKQGEISIEWFNKIIDSLENN